MAINSYRPTGRFYPTTVSPEHFVAFPKQQLPCMNQHVLIHPHLKCPWISYKCVRIHNMYINVWPRYITKHMHPYTNTLTQTSRYQKTSRYLLKGCRFFTRNNLKPSHDSMAASLSRKWWKAIDWITLNHQPLIVKFHRKPLQSLAINEP